MVTTYPGFRDTVHDAQQSFRTLLGAMAHPGRLYSMTAELTPPMGLMPATAATCLTLLDLDVSVWLQPGWHRSVRPWLLFHTGCRMVEDGAIAHVALMHTWKPDTSLTQFFPGTPEDPEQSTTLLIQLADLHNGTQYDLSGPGVPTSQLVAPHLPSAFWDNWQTNRHTYPLGVDAFLFHHDRVIGLPRSISATAR